MLPIRIATVPIGPALPTLDAVATEARPLSIPVGLALSGTGRVIGRLPGRVRRVVLGAVPDGAIRIEAPRRTIVTAR